VDQYLARSRLGRVVAYLYLPSRLDRRGRLGCLDLLGRLGYLDLLDGRLGSGRLGLFGRPGLLGCLGREGMAVSIARSGIVFL